MRRTARLIGAAGAVLAVALAGCASPEYRFVGSSERDVVLRVPSSWSAVDTADALKATGTDPKTMTGWTVFYDASDKPSANHLKALSADAPMMYARSIPVASEQRASVTDDQMLELVLPGTPEERLTATASKDFAIVARQAVNTKRQHGIHVNYTYNVGTTTPLLEHFDAIVMTNPKRTALSMLLVHCNQRCFEAHPEIDDVVTSLTMKSR